MKKSISKVLMLILAVVLVASSLGTTMAFAADTATLVLDSGAITISPVVNNPAMITITQVNNPTITTAAINTVVIKQVLASTTNTITVNSGVNAGVNVNIRFASAVNIASATGSALTIGAGSTVNLTSSPSPAVSTLTGAVNQPAVSGGTLNANGGLLTLTRGTSSALTVNGGAAVTLTKNDNGVSATSSVVVNNGALTLASGSISGAVTLTNGSLIIASGATPPTNLTVNGGTYNNGGTVYHPFAITLPYSTTYTGAVTYVYSGATIKGTAKNGVFTASLPAKSSSKLTTTVGNIEYSADITVQQAGGSATAKAKATLKDPASITNLYTGTWFDRLNLPKTVDAKLGSGKDVPIDVKWVQGTYSSTSQAEQKIRSKTLTPPTDIILDKTESTIIVKLKYKSSGGGSSESQANPEYDFWRGVLSDVENASSGDTIYAYANSYSNMPSTILETLKGKNITLIITRKNGNDIKIYGKNIRSLESGRITYSISQLAELFKNGGTSSENASTSSKIPTTAPSTAPSTYVPPATSNAPATTVKPSSSSSSEESAASPEEEEPSSSEEEFEPSEPEVVPTDQPIEVTPKKKLSPLSIAIIVTVGAAILSGIVACIVLQRRNKHDQF